MHDRFGSSCTCREMAIQRAGRREVSATFCDLCVAKSKRSEFYIGVTLWRPAKFQAGWHEIRATHQVGLGIRLALIERSLLFRLQKLAFDGSNYIWSGTKRGEDDWFNGIRRLNSRNAWRLVSRSGCEQPRLGGRRPDFYADCRRKVGQPCTISRAVGWCCLLSK